MQITLDQSEMEEAIKIYINSKGLAFGGEEPKITFTAGRAPSGMTASIDMSQIRTVPMGPGEIEILDKPVVDLEPFKTEPEEKTKTKTKTKAKKKKKTNDETNTNLFGERDDNSTDSSFETKKDLVEEEEEGATNTDTLFAT